MTLELARTVADAVLYEGYLLYPYRSTSSKNRVRWQFGVLGPPGAAAGGFGEVPDMQAECLLSGPPDSTVTLRLRFLQLQTRDVQQASAPDAEDFAPVPEFRLGSQTWLTWDETTEHEILLDTCSLAELEAGRTLPVDVAGGEDVEPLRDEAGRVVARVVRRRWPLAAKVTVSADPVDALHRLRVRVENVATAPVSDKDEAIRTSFIGAHLLISADNADFVSLLEPPDDAKEAAAACQQHRCWPVLAGAPGDTDVVLASPIILYDYPEIADQSAGALFDSTEIDEILTLRVMTLTDEEKAQARATDPRAAEIIDRCDAMSPETLQELHGILRNPHAVDASLAAGMTAFDPYASALEPSPSDTAYDRAELAGGMGVFDVPTFSTPRSEAGEESDVRNVDPPLFDTGDVPWWDPAADASVQPDVDAVLIDGVSVAKDSLVRVHPSVRADAQDMFFADQTARVTAVLSDVEGNVHVAVVLVDDPAADMHDWYGRYLYFSPEELEPLGTAAAG